MPVFPNLQQAQDYRKANIPSAPIALTEEEKLVINLQFIAIRFAATKVSLQWEAYEEEGQYIETVSTDTFTRHKVELINGTTIMVDETWVIGKTTYVAPEPEEGILPDEETPNDSDPRGGEGSTGTSEDNEDGHADPIDPEVPEEPEP
jgi:hypothetical protein